MKTMIPNKLRFDLDLQDLPARATKVASEALGLTGGGCVPKGAITNDDNVPIWTNHMQIEDAGSMCNRMCGNSPGSSLKVTSNGHNYNYYQCLCCDKKYG